MNDDKELRIEDLKTFVQAVENLRKSDPEDRGKLSDLLSGIRDQPFSTTLGQLNRLVNRLGRSVDIPVSEGAPLDLFFRKEGSAYKITDEAEKFESACRILLDVYDKVRLFLVERPQSKSKVRIGAPQTIGLRVISNLLSNWRRLFGTKMDLHLELDNTSALLPRLDAGLLDFVVGHVPEDVATDGPPVKDSRLDISYRSFGYRSPSILICHPEFKLWGKGKSPRNLNEGYWDKVFLPHYRDEVAMRTTPRTRGGRTSRPSLKDDRHTLKYSDLRPIELNELNFDDMHLISVRSWRPPEPVRELVATLRAAGRVTEIVSHEEALARARTGEGVAIVNQLFMYRRRIVAFRLEPQEEFTRWIGVYYSLRRGVSPEACMVLRFIEDFFRECKKEIAEGEPIGFAHPVYEKFCGDFQERVIDNPNISWKYLASQRYPTADRVR